MSRVSVYEAQLRANGVLTLLMINHFRHETAADRSAFTSAMAAINELDALLKTRIDALVYAEIMCQRDEALAMNSRSLPGARLAS